MHKCIAITKNCVYLYYKTNKDMNAFSKNFYQSNKTYTVKMATEKLISLGYSDFQFKSCSFANGASFYFTSKDGQEIRVSDHPLTGKRATTTIQVSLVEVKKLSAKPKTEDSDFKKRLAEMIANRNK